jgi:hypothetical protein
MQNLYLMKANKLSTRKRDLITNLKDALIAEELGSNRETTTTEAAAVAAAEAVLVAVTDGKK